MSDATSSQNYPWLQNYDPGVDWAMEIEAKPVTALLDETVKKFANRPAFNFLGKTWTWGAIATSVDRFATGLQAQGLEKGQHVGLFLPNCPYFLIAYYGILKAGGTVVNFNPLYARREIANQIEDSEVDMMVTVDLAMLYEKMDIMLRDTRLKRVIVCPFMEILPFPKNILFKIFKKSDLAVIPSDASVIRYKKLVSTNAEFTPVDVDPENDLAVLQYTGGTTGVPKGAMLTHKNVYANTLQSVSLFPQIKPGEQKMLGVLPFFHVFAMTAVMNFSVAVGFEIVALPRFDLKDTLKTIDKEKPHFFPAVPAIYSAINSFGKLDNYDLSSLQFCISGGAPLPVEVKRSFEGLTGCIVVEGYGLTESSPVACVNPIVGENIAGSIGLPVPQTVISIIDPKDKKTEMPLGTRGEICIQGPQVMKGYWNKTEDTADVLREGRLHTGDIGIMDDRGYVYVVDRIKDMIITNGYNVYPRNVEEAIYLHPNVEECVVAGLPDKKRGEIVKAWIKLKDERELSEKDLKEFLADQISKMEIPRLIEFRAAPLPKTMIGKLSRKMLLEEEALK